MRCPRAAPASRAKISTFRLGWQWGCPSPMVVCLPDSSRNRVVAQVAAHLLVAPTLEHLIDGLRLRMQQRHRSDDMNPTALVEGQISLPPSLTE